MSFTQLKARLKNFLMDWLLVLGIEEGLVECVTVCVKSVVILQVLLVVYFDEITSIKKPQLIVIFVSYSFLLGFYQQCNLKRHMASHNTPQDGAEGFKCSHCFASFTTKSGAKYLFFSPLVLSK